MKDMDKQSQIAYCIFYKGFSEFLKADSNLFTRVDMVEFVWAILVLVTKNPLTKTI